MIFCENGYYQTYRLRDHAPYRYLSVNDILKHSSNIGVAKLAIQMGEKNFYEYVRRFGFGDSTGISLPAEERGVVHPPQVWDKLTETRMAMGHAVTVTPLQVAAAMSVIANGGKLMMPQIVKDVTDEHGVVVSTFPPQEVRPVCRESAARAVRDAMIDVCTPKGTAEKARVFGYKVAGKTGTAQKPDGKGGYLHEKYVVSFAGFMPADDPAFVAVVVFDEARTKSGQNFGGLVAAPIFSRIAEKAARYLGLPATETRMQGETGAVFAREGKGINAQ
jgi:cell division protein FtsI/penicillin-binding protein 2